MKPLNVLVAGRQRTHVDELVMRLLGLRNVEVRSRLIVNGHGDPLYGIEPLPDLLVFAMSENDASELVAFTARPMSQRPELVVVSEDEQLDAVRAAMRAGAREFLRFPPSPEELAKALEALAAERAPSISNERQLVAVLGAKGGAGASSLAVNLGLMAAKSRRTALLDLNVQAGALPVYLDLSPTGGGLVEALERAQELDTVAIDGYMLRHGSGLRVLAADTQRIMTPEDISETAVQRLMDVLRAAYQLVLVDLPRQVDKLSGSVLAAADRIYLVVQQNVVQMHEAKRLVHLLTHLAGVDPDRLVAVVNRWHKHGEVDVKAVRRTLGIEDVVCIPNDFERMQACENAGTPVVATEPGTAVAKAYLSLAADLGLESESQRGLLGGLLAWRKG